MRRHHKVVRMRRAKIPSVSFIIFIGIFVYVFAYFIFYLNRDKTSIYRVMSDTRVNEILEKGVILRNEKVFHSQNSGYLNYYVNPLSVVSKKDIIYTVDSTGSIYSKLHSEENTKKFDESNLKNLLYFYHKENKDFFSIYQLKTNLKETLLEKSSLSIVTNLKDVIKNYGDHQYFHVNYSSDSGIIAYGTDGLENLSLNQIDASLFQGMSNHAFHQPPENSEKVEQGTPIYRLISDEVWQVVVPISEAHFLKLKDMTYVDATLDGRNFKAKAKVETFKNREEHYAVLTFFNYMVNFANKRFIQVRIVLDSVTGLKISKSSVVNKKFYLIPSDFLVSRNKVYEEKGINLLTYDKKGNPTYRFIPTTVYFEKDGYLYIDADREYAAGDQIAKEKAVNEKGKSSDYLTTISKVDTLNGAFNVNKGYPEFRRIEIISDIDSDYYLISDKTLYGLSEYDNLILNAEVLERGSND